MGKLKIVTIVLMLVFIAGILCGCDAGRAIAEWDKCYMEYGIFLEPVPLTVEQENSLGQLIFNYELFESEQEENVEPGDILCGEHSFWIEFKKDEITYLWSFDAHSVCKTALENGEEIEKVYYLADLELLDILNSYRNQEEINGAKK